MVAEEDGSEGSQCGDWAHFIRALAQDYVEAETITLILDSLNTHGPGSFYETFPPATAKALWDRFELVYTPKHGSWLNIAEIELSALARHCLDRRIDTQEMTSEISAWQDRRNNWQAAIDWQFTAEDARVKLKRIYPTLAN